MEELIKYQLNKNILCIDIKSFYASVECVLRGLDPFDTLLAVADKERCDTSVVLAITPLLKEKGVKSRTRIFQIPKELDVIYAQPRMNEYIKFSTKIIEIYLQYVSKDDLYVYSIDEAFLDLTNYLDYYQKTDVEVAKEILDKITNELGLYATCGIGPNMLMAKVSMDTDAKHSKEFIAKWTYKDVETKLWNLKPLSKMWGIGNKMEHHLNVLGLNSIGDIAKYDKDLLKKRFGVLGEELWYHCNGIDMSLLQEKDLLRKDPKSFGISQVLHRNYNATEIQTIILEMIDDVTRRLRAANKQASCVSLAIGYSSFERIGFSRQVTLDQPTNNESIIYKELLNIFDIYYTGEGIRTVSVTLSKMSNNNVYQYSMFEDKEKLDKELTIQKTVDKIKKTYGKNSITRGSAQEEHSTAKVRNKQVGGHHV